MYDRNALDKLASELKGLVVLGCLSGSPAARAGLRYGDIVVRVNGLETPDWKTFVQARDLDSEKLVIDVFRDGALQTIEMALEPSRRRNVDPLEILSELVSERILATRNADGLLPDGGESN